MKAGWKVKKLGEVCSFENGDRGTNYPSRSARTSTGIPFINAGHLTEDGIDITCLDYIPRSRFDLLGSGKIRKGDILFCLRGSLGKFASVGDLYEGAIASSLVIIRPGNDIIEKFLLAYLASKLCSMQIEKCRNGAAQPNLSAGNLSQFPIPVPPLPEQQRIVAILDEAFESIATAKANAEQNRKNARELFDSYLQSVFTQRGEGWVEKKLEDVIASNVLGLIRSVREQGINMAYKYFKMNNITRKNEIDFSNFIRIDATPEEVKKFKLCDNDFLFNTRNSFELVGKVGVYHSSSDEAVLFNNNIMRIRFIDGIDAMFIRFAFSSTAVSEKLNKMKNGTTNVSAIYYKDLKNLPVPVPPIAQQLSIVACLDALSAETQRLKAIYRQKIAALDELKQSLLQKAFAGKL